jgi:hypothetical protein
MAGSILRNVKLICIWPSLHHIRMYLLGGRTTDYPQEPKRLSLWTDAAPTRR